MKLLFINPNSTAAMTADVVTTARALCPEAEVLGWTNADGPPAIQGPEDGAASVPGVLALLAKARAAGVQAIVIACFDDTGLAEVRAAAHCPVIGIGQAAYHMAALLGGGFSVVTTLAVSVPVIEGNIRALGFGDTCLEVRPSGLGVLEVEDGSPATLAILSTQIRAAQAQGAEQVVLGCAGMTRHLGALQQATGVRLVDGVRAATLLAVALASQEAANGAASHEAASQEAASQEAASQEAANEVASHGAASHGAASHGAA